MECWDNYQDCDENVYENTRICIAKRKPDINLDTIELQAKERHSKADSSISEISLDAKDLLTNLEQYETLRSVTRKSDGRNNDEKTKDQGIKWEDLPRKIKIIIYAFSLMLVMLFIIDVIAAVVIVLSLPKSEDGGWSNWGSWGSCSESCGGGIKSRLRTCTNPRPSPFGKGCDGSSEQVVMCNKNACADGGWSNWGSWGSCSESCGGGIKSRLRTCTNPRPSPFGKGCDGSSEQVVMCNKNACADGGWSNWGSWGSCSESCGGGIKSRLRTCTNPRPSPFGKGCDGSSEQVVMCNKNACADGGWSIWESWGSCSESCGGGVKSRLRTCTNPRPSPFGKGCDGSSEQVVTCNKNACADGGWSIWGSWGSCSESCGGGIKSRLRTCTNPRPSPFGKGCDGSSEQVVMCNKNACADGGWSNWGSWGSCSVSCSGGIRSRLRTCTNPRPSPFGKGCDGSSEQVVMCNKNACADGGWSNWGSWGSCSESCGGGVKSRLRTCTNPRPSPFGKGCDGSSEQVVMCNKNACADGAWSYWGSWGSCSESCSGGIKSRLRTCTNPRPSPFGKGCDGSSEQVILCNKQTCDDHKVSFLAYGSTTVVSSSVLKFPTISFNSGNGYSSSTGRFTCKIPGIYNFAVTLTKPRRDINYISAYLQINGIYKLQLYTNPYDYGNYDYGSYSLSVTGNFYLNSNDYVDVYTVPNNFYNDYSTSFTGVLVIPDN